MNNTATNPPLTGIKVLELAQLLPGPLLARKLGDLGAEVIKVEPPHGDPMRGFPPIIDGRSVMFEAVNRGKRSVALDLRDGGDRARLDALLEVADVVVEGYRVGALAALGVDLQEARRRRPELVVCSVSGFGQSGPLAHLPAHGLNVDFLSAGLAVGGQDGDYRLTSDVSYGVELGAINGAVATLAALFRARVSGQGAWLDVSCWDAAVEAHRLNLYPMLAGQPIPGLTGAHSPMQSIYRAEDGAFVQIMATEQRLWRNFWNALGRQDLADSWEQRDYIDEAERPGDHELREEIARIIASAPGAEWTRRFTEWGVAGCALLTEKQVIEHPHLAARGLVGESAQTSLPFIADPVRFADDDWRPASDGSAAPTLDADKDYVAASWGAAEIRSV
ncbi:CaiB/BaiF CoA transferase family protein [[Mycobacterium] burgundiense]|uniref:CoA transferase n=1 Tax=[Mycobacterium] burgundiense TaxID=3064286 RepID=A0ABM9LK40_9MYCO|nr:CoA transferase [Mycolicibacterium sp. MU0053]CAJ1500450.1 CoA transferase [Mycolicibacterium sp. MU0053]